MKKYLITESLNKLKSGTRIVAVDLKSVNHQAAGFDSESDLVDLIHRITDKESFDLAYEKRLKGSLGENIALILNELEKTCKENDINLQKFLDMSRRFYKFEE